MFEYIEVLYELSVKTEIYRFLGLFLSVTYWDYVFSSYTVVDPFFF